MSDHTYCYRGPGYVGNPGQDVVEDVELAVMAEDEGATIRIRSKQFPGGEIQMTDAQLNHLCDALDGADPAEPESDDADAAPVIDAEGKPEGDAWRPL